MQSPGKAVRHDVTAGGHTTGTVTITVSSFGPCAPITMACSMSAVFDGPATNVANEATLMSIR